MNYIDTDIDVIKDEISDYIVENHNLTLDNDGDEFLSLEVEYLHAKLLDARNKQPEGWLEFIEENYDDIPCADELLEEVA